MDVGAIIFDFDGVLIESESALNRLIAGLLTELGHPHSFGDAIEHFTGLAGRNLIDVIEARIGDRLPDEFHARLSIEGKRSLEEGIAPVSGATEFVRSLPSHLPRAIASSSSTRWIRAHLAHLGLSDAFEPHIYSGREHVERGKPAPDLYLHAAEELAIPISRTVIVEDSRVGAAGALASGGMVIGFAGGTHCLEGHDAMLRAAGVKEIAGDFDELAAMLNFDQPSR